MKSLSHLFAVMMLFSSMAGDAAAAPDLRREGAALTADFHAGRIDALWQRMHPEMQEALASPQALSGLREQVLASFGRETTVVEESTRRVGGQGIYLRTVRFENSPTLIELQWTIDPEGRISGFFIRPQQAAQVVAASDHLHYQTRTPLRLPFDEEFHVFWGGRSVKQNYHAADASQRFAMDLVALREDRSYQGEGTRNEDYYCFGKPILAPAAGTVVEVVEGVQDNTPGQMNPAQPTGNRVIIDHGNNEYSLLAHLRHGSVQVVQGQQVGAGARLGECGNSGNSSEPHLHYQLQAGPVLGSSPALPAQFIDYLADGRVVARGEPVQGQTIRPQQR